MSKFKVGDRVTVTKDNSPYAKVGDVGVIITINCNDRDCLVKFENDIYGDGCWHIGWSELNPCASPIRTVTRKEIVAGEYGNISIDVTSNKYVGVYIKSNMDA